MDDRELLELAAKAAGKRIDEETFGEYQDAHNGCVVADGNHWNPLNDDGDALRLAVKLGITPIIRHFGCDATDCGKGMAYERWVRSGGDRLQATRRAIVRAAAEIGRQVP